MVFSTSFPDVPEIEVTISSNSESIHGNPYILVCSHRSAEPNFIYSPTFEWCHNGDVLVGERSRVLHFSSLSFSDVGNYTCKITATSDSLGIPIFDMSDPHQIILQGTPNNFSSDKKQIYYNLEGFFLVCLDAVIEN